MERGGRAGLRGAQSAAQSAAKRSAGPESSHTAAARGWAQRKKSLLHSRASGSCCSTCPARKANLCAYLQGAGTRMVPGQFQ